LTRFDDTTPEASVARPAAGFGIRSAVTRRWLLFALYGALIVLGAGLGRQLLEIAWPYFHPAHGASLHWMIAAAIVVYAVVMAVPFVPAAEIGLTLLLLFGPQVALLVYLSTVLALMLPYLIGRAVPPDLCARALGFFGLRRASDLAQRLAALDANARLKLLLAQAPAPFIPALLRHRYIALAIVLNLPGNTLLGGGAGIALCAGICGL
jgi:uncharacterized membrane protein YdjX (TVP38/TMEM64 family)